MSSDASDSIILPDLENKTQGDELPRTLHLRLQRPTPDNGGSVLAGRDPYVFLGRKRDRLFLFLVINLPLS